MHFFLINLFHLMKRNAEHLSQLKEVFPLSLLNLSSNLQILVTFQVLVVIARRIILQSRGSELDN